ncbi:unnamed protein product [Tuber aestivum]|uniref:Uncharacterized protein n=1 Tax=Tuber aestivum TaxID=59557 RepID=A0A292PZH5_9PEZI|nr:unnamed protein product [Tuber aestivum]
MGRKSTETIKTSKTPKYIAETGMTPNQYFDLKVHIKSITLPGTPGFEGKRFSSRESERAYRQWLHNALLQLGPKFFPGGGKGLAWPQDYEGIHKAVHQVVRSLSYKIRKNYANQVERVSVAGGKAWNDKTKAETPEAGDRCGCGPICDSDVDEGVVMIDKEVGREQNQVEEVTVTKQHHQDREVTEEEMKAAAIGLEDLLDLMRPEVSPQLPDLTMEDFDWDEVADTECPELVVRGLSCKLGPTGSLVSWC